MQQNNTKERQPRLQNKKKNIVVLKKKKGSFSRTVIYRHFIGFHWAYGNITETNSSMYDVDVFERNEILIQRSSFYSYPTAVVNFNRDRALPELISYFLQDNFPLA